MAPNPSGGIALLAWRAFSCQAIALRPAICSSTQRRREKPIGSRLHVLDVFPLRDALPHPPGLLAAFLEHEGDVAKINEDAESLPENEDKVSPP